MLSVDLKVVSTAWGCFFKKKHFKLCTKVLACFIYLFIYFWNLFLKPLKFRSNLKKKTKNILFYTLQIWRIALDDVLCGGKETFQLFFHGNSLGDKRCLVCICTQQARVTIAARLCGNDTHHFRGGCTSIGPGSAGFRTLGIAIISQTLSMF